MRCRDDDVLAVVETMQRDGDGMVDGCDEEESSWRREDRYSMNKVQSRDEANMNVNGNRWVKTRWEKQLFCMLRVIHTLTLSAQRGLLHTHHPYTIHHSHTPHYLPLHKTKLSLRDVHGVLEYMELQSTS